MDQHSCCPPWIISLLFLLFLVITVSSQDDFEFSSVGSKPNITSCFQYDTAASCDVPLNATTLDPLYINKVCEWIIYDYIYWEEITWGNDIQDAQVEALAALQIGNDCDDAREAWPHCYFCLSPDDRDYERRGEWCWLEEDVCIPPGEEGSIYKEPDTRTVTEIRETCDLLAVVMSDLAFPQTVDYCKQAEATLYACDWYCLDGHRNPEYYSSPTNESCWTFDDPPICTNPPPPLTNTSIDLEYECHQLRTQMDDRWFLANPWTHVYGFSSILKNETQCDIARQVYPYCMWCHPMSEGNEDWCLDHHACDNAGGRKPMIKDPNVNLREACDILEPIYTNNNRAETAELCYIAEMSLHACNWKCEQPYLGAETETQKQTLIWLARTSGFLSFAGATFVLYDILSQRKNRQTVYHQFLVGVAIFDIVSASAWICSTAPLPQQEAFNIRGASGNEATCRTQAFFIQLGFTSMFYNTVLAVYYVLVVVYSWRETALKRIRPFLHGGPLVIGVGLAVAVIPYADWTGYGCHIVPYPDDDRWKALVFVVIPLGISVLAITLSMAYMCYKVREIAQASRKWSTGRGRDMLSQVFCQALLYALSFYITNPILFAVYAGSVDYKASTFALTATVSFMAPFQGFTNFLVYGRSAVAKNWRSRRRGDKNNSAGSSNNGQALAYAEQQNSLAISQQQQQNQQPSKVLSSFIQSFSDCKNSFRFSSRDVIPRQNNGKGAEPSSAHVKESADMLNSLPLKKSVGGQKTTASKLHATNASTTSNMTSFYENTDRITSVNIDEEETNREVTMAEIIDSLEARITQYEGMDPSALMALLNEDDDNALLLMRHENDRFVSTREGDLEEEKTEVGAENAT